MIAKKDQVTIAETLFIIAISLTLHSPIFGHGTDSGKPSCDR
jgi:hypothetical protein